MADIDENGLGPQGQQTVFHGAMIYNMRIQDILTECGNMAIKGDFVLWKRLLDRLHLEIEYKIKDKKANDKIIIHIQTKVLPPMMILQRSLDTKDLRTANKLMDVCYTQLGEYERLLRRHIGEKGYMGPEKRSRDFMHEI